MFLSYGNAVWKEPLPLRVRVVPLFALLALRVPLEALVHLVAALLSHLLAASMMLAIRWPYDHEGQEKNGMQEAHGAELAVVR